MSDAAWKRAVAVARPARVGALLRLGPGEPSVVHSQPSRGLHAVGLGVALEGLGEVRWLSAPPATPPPGPFFGGFAFDAQRPWDGYPNERWVLPEVLGWWDGAQAWLAAFAPEGSSAGELEARLDAVREVEPFVGRLSSIRHGEGRTAFEALVAAAEAEVRQGETTKLVVARQIDVECAQEIPVRAVLKALEARFQDCLTFLVRGADGSCFLGATPETLCRVSGEGTVETEALAGTGAPGTGEALLRSDKDRREHAVVVETITRTLAPLADDVRAAPEPGLRVLPNVVHLRTPISARLKPGVAPLALAKALHPTPAVAGAPSAEAQRWLAAREGFSRGWYAGAVGTFGPQGLMLGVALRSAWISGRRARVFAGAGIVAGSRPEAEWEETERKAAPLLDVLGVARA